ncbi:MAG TPA: DPP IV N-terminal domain-containing protein, partial [Terriglobales bacterium]|nr:DPP IV N-terminal domain-containing protein [Terriglobales bacterium]
MKRILPLCFVVSLSVSLAFAQAAPASQPPAQLTVEAIFAEGGLTGRGPETVQWSPDGTKVSFVQRDDAGEHGALYYVDLSTGKKAVLVAEEKLATLEPPVSKIKDEREKERIQRYSVAGYHWAPDSQHLLFDSRGQLWLYSLATGTAVQLTASPDPSSDPKFSPDGKRVAFVRNHNLWVHATDGSSEKQVTTADKDKDAKPGDILNGEVDWVYAEELDVRSNYFWSPEGKHIAFLQMNEKRVPQYPITDWIPQHPNVDEEKYPKAGDPNPEVRLGIIGSDGGRVKWIDVGQAADREYIPRFGWVREGIAWVQLLNRAQTKLDLYFVDIDSGRSQKMLSETSDAWVEIKDIDQFKILGSGDRFLWPSWRDGYNHLYLYSFDKANPTASPATLTRQLTRGEFEVESLDGLDEASGTAYFTANADDPRQRQFYSVKLDGSPMQQLSREPGTHHVSMPDKPTYYVDTFSATAVPPRMSVCKIGAECTAFWQARSVEQFSLLVPKPVQLKAADKSTTLYGTLLMPPADVIAAHGGKIPLITNPYGGPGAQNVRDQWGGSNYLFDVILARDGFAILHVDNRGMASRGRAFTAAVKGHFGDIELADQLTALDQVLAANPQLDGNRVGWWGWSYGGYMTL